MMDLWLVFCGKYECSQKAGESCSSTFLDTFSCTSHILIIFANILLLMILVFLFSTKFSSRKSVASSEFQGNSILSSCSYIFNGSLALAYLSFGTWKVLQKLIAEQTVLPLHQWLVPLSQGLTWLLLSLLSIYKKQYTSSPGKLCVFLASLLAAFLCISSVWQVIVENVVYTKSILDMLPLLGVILMTVSASKGQRELSTCEPLLGEEADNACGKVESNEKTTPFAKAGIFSRMSFCWLNDLLKKGKEKILNDEDIPELRPEDQAGMLYSLFKEQVSNARPSVFSAIVCCQWKAIVVSGLFALIKTVTVSIGPLFLYAFIELAKGNGAFKYEGYVLAGGILIAKCIESLAERQWFFRTRLIGLQVKSLLTAAIYDKQLRLSNTAKNTHSPGEIINYATVDTFKVGEFPYWCHQLWTTGVQVCIALVIMYYAVGLATVPALLLVVASVLGNSPVAKSQHKYLTELMIAQDRMLRAITEALTSMKVLKLYAWEKHFKNAIEKLREDEYRWLSAVQMQKGYYLVLFWSTPIIVSAVTFCSCYLLKVPLNTTNVFTFLATLRIVQEPVRSVPDILGVSIEAKVSLSRIVEFLEAPELQNRRIEQKYQGKQLEHSIIIKSKGISWDASSHNPAVKSVNLHVKQGQKLAICGEVGSGKSTLLAAILGEVPYVDGLVQVHGTVAYVSQNAWIQTGSIRENILFGSTMDQIKYQEVLDRCSLVKDLEMFPFGDQTIIGERGVNLSGGQKQRVQLARALYQDADIYLLDDPFSAVDAHTSTCLFNEYVMGALSGKTVLLVTHQVDFLPTFDSILLMSEGNIIQSASFDQLLLSCEEFQNLIHAHDEAIKSESNRGCSPQQRTKSSVENIHPLCAEEQLITPVGEQLIKQEERETGYTGLKPYKQYLGESNGLFYLLFVIFSHLLYMVGQLGQNLLLAADLQSSRTSKLSLILIYSSIGFGMSVTLLFRSYVVLNLGLKSSKSIFAKLLTSIFRAPMSFYDSTPLGRILSRLSSDLSVLDLDLSFRFSQAASSTLTTYFSLGILAALTWPILIIIIPMIYMTVILQRFYFASAKELMRIDGTTKSAVASHLAEAIAGAMTIRAFEEEDRFCTEYLHLVDRNAIAFFHSFSATEWLIQRLEILCAIVLSSSALAMVLLPFEASDSGYIGMALSYALSLNVFLVASVQTQCMLENAIISVERLEQYMHIPSEHPEFLQDNRPDPSWPSIGKVEIVDLKVRYQPTAPLVLQGISCTIEGGYKVGIVGRTGSGKTTLISALFRLVEPTEGMIIIDGINISTIGIHDLRSSLSIIPQDPMLFSGTVRYNLDPLSEHTDQEIWEVLRKCQLQDVVQQKEGRLYSSVSQDGSNWSMGQRQLFCLGRALLQRRKILVLDEATASIDNTTDSIIQKTIRTEFEDCTVITVAHRIPTVMDCTMVLAISDGKLVEYDKPMELMNKESSLFGQLVDEYWSHSQHVDIHMSNQYGTH
ncbi:ABC transporter C family member 10-like [Solanum pennellii]|uniref:ABC-type xenobiotic transporter n=1 Tax=Solanum pennellii TaxID=28526 RepID=A0ABM1VGM6_SOLPN|nr:ABC transporter C family member 10-like [Solanum pennellii]XP_015085481.1 ABC transporter C family member 10-like [Solanum pennellii]XP_015085482.1 ABC transporter C family member 10-like [Solanum pennellii]XP_027774893.1 ABC transporter C family member 10-like [Solanum pennellii]XP_027774894.1 ABC transporter C family member 10-like [Solanum pennellii]